MIPMIVEKTRTDAARKIARRMKGEGAGWEDILVKLRQAKLDVIDPRLIKAFVLGGRRS